MVICSLEYGCANDTRQAWSACRLMAPTGSAGPGVAARCWSGSGESGIAAAQGPAQELSQAAQESAQAAPRHALAASEIALVS